ncbi:hypothetical protein [Pseudomonas sp. PSKL.D1]|uniref:hypothetical protein n=1 Tax=Pseudomonas sp. PSKL.D1 TaxID=3029060 RepID=UPI002380F7D7|nr:hypothetical protein [Pseudomonas sp. PSKL.D1]WDY57006.1 hypothetical protein PVV54_20865 [Pseudomonas sp. PSKL.D1]
MSKGNIYDRLWQYREAEEARARQQAEEERLAAEAARNAPPPELALDLEQNALRIAGLNLLIPTGFAFRRFETTLEFAGCQVAIGARRRCVAEGLSLSEAVDQFIEKLRQHHGDITVVRRAETLLAGHPAICLDYQFRVGQVPRHGRAACSHIDAADGNARQWLSVFTVIDPHIPQLADWLIAFDAMLAGVTAQ